MPDSWAIDNAIIAKLAADATLLTFVPNGVYWQVAPPDTATQQMRQFVVVSLSSTEDGRRQGSRGREEVIYEITAVVLGTVPNAAATARQAAARIDAVLDPQPPAPPASLTVAGYAASAIYREPDFRIHNIEVDDVDPTIRWYWYGGHYRVVMSL